MFTCRSTARGLRLGLAVLLAAVAVSCTGGADDASTSASTATTSDVSASTPEDAGTHDMSDAIPLPSSTSGLADGGSGEDELSEPPVVVPSSQPTNPVESSSTASPGPSDGSSAPARSVEIVTPRDGASVSAAVTIDVDVSGFELVELGGDFRQDEGHLWVFVDEEPPAERVVLPESTSIVKSASPSIYLGSLAPGEHTVTVVASHGYPVPFEPRVQDTVTFTVTPE